MAVTFRNTEYTGPDQRFFDQLVREIERLRQLTDAQATEIAYLKGRVR